MNFDAIFWDLDGTLYDCYVYGEEDIENLLWADLDSFLSPTPDPFENKERETLARQLTTLLEEISSGSRITKRFQPYAGIRDLLGEIPRRKQGIITNQWPHVQVNKLRILGLYKHFEPDLIFTSYGEGMKLLRAQHPCLREFESELRGVDPDNPYCDDSVRVVGSNITGKPYPYMFQKALEIVGFDAQRCIMVGDERADIKGAKAVGMKTLYMQNVNPCSR